MLEGNYTVVVTDATGCTATASVDVVDQPGPVAGFISTEVCKGSPTIFTDTSVNGVAWSWDMGDANSYILQNVQHTYDAEGTYTVTLTVSDVNGCIDTFTAEVRVKAMPTASFEAAPLGGCTPVTTSFVNTGSSFGATCLWEYGDGSTSAACTGTSHTYVVPGCYDVKLTVTSDGCTSQFTAAQLICVDPLPIADFSITPNPALTVTPFVAYTDRSVGATNYFWTFEGGVPGTSTLPNVYVNYSIQEPGYYESCLLVTNDAGCADSLCRVLTIMDDLRVNVPNSFTPNGDGINDVFIPILAGNSKDEYLLSIYNRWGELIFETDALDQGWDGRYKEMDAQDGVYIWKLKSRASIGVERREITGHVTLLR